MNETILNFVKLIEAYSNGPGPLEFMKEEIEKKASEDWTVKSDYSDPYDECELPE